MTECYLFSIDMHEVQNPVFAGKQLTQELSPRMGPLRTAERIYYTGIQTEKNILFTY
jgi:hypothetical protein